MEDMEPEPDIFCNKTRAPLVGLGHQHNLKTFVLQPSLLERYTGPMVVQRLWEWPTNGCSKLRAMLCEGAHTWPFLDGQELEARYRRVLG